MRTQHHRTMDTKELQALEHAFEELDDRLINHDCTYEDGCPCYDWMLDRYEHCLELRGFKQTDEEINNDIKRELEFAHGL